MKLWIDGDALPNRLKGILRRAIQRKHIDTCVVSNKVISLGKPHPLIEYIVVEAGPDVADDYIADGVQQGDLVITADIPLADRAISKGAQALDHRGKMFTEANVKRSLAMRNLMEDLQNMEENIRRGPAPYSEKDARLFANHFSAFLDAIKKAPRK